MPKIIVRVVALSPAELRAYPLCDVPKCFSRATKRVTIERANSKEVLVVCDSHAKDIEGAGAKP